MPSANHKLVDTIQRHAVPLQGSSGPFDALLDWVGDARYVLIGEASHGTHEFYRARAEITKELIRRHGFTAVAVEADWPDAYRVNCYVRGDDDDQSAVEALDNFKRFPTWMWRNADVLDFVGWLRTHNQGRPAQQQTGFYGIDLYSLHSSMEAVLRYLEETDPEAVQRARARYSCFDHYGEEPQTYGYATTFGLAPSCEDEVIAQLLELQRAALAYGRRDGGAAEDAFFYAEQNARVAQNAEAYYRAMFQGRDESWNLRDTHMMETVEALVTHLGRHGDQPKIVIWAHNSHLGDARATDFARMGQLNLGQLVRQAHPDDSALIGFTTYTGTVTAASDWDAPPERKRVRPGLNGSYEGLFHEMGIPAFMLNLRDEPVAEALRGPLLERAIGVIYRPETERWSHYFDAYLAEQFDAVIHFDETRAVEPLGRLVGATPHGESPETFPSGM